MVKSEEILTKHCIELDDVFLITRKDRAFKQKVLDAMEEYAQCKEADAHIKNDEEPPKDDSQMSIAMD